MLLLFFLYFFWAICMFTSSVSEQEKAASGGCVQVGISHVPLWWAWVWGCPVFSTLWATCNHLIIRVSWASSGTRGRTGGLLPLSPGGSSSRAVLTPNLNFWHYVMQAVLCVNCPGDKCLSHAKLMSTALTQLLIFSFSYLLTNKGIAQCIDNSK